MSPDRRSSERLTIDASLLPEVTFGHRGLNWWATVAFIGIEATTLAICVAAYLYIRMDNAEWPPRPLANPDLLIPTINLAVILGSIWPKSRAQAAAKRFDVGGVRRWMVLACVFGLTANALRLAELQGLNARWDTNAYGSAVWAILVAHTTLLVADLAESLVITAIFFSERLQPRHFPDVEEDAVYQRFLSLAWVVLFAVVYLAPRVL